MPDLISKREYNKLTSRAGFHNAILRDLSSDLGIDLRTLQRTVTFYQTYKRPPRVEGLSWAHYRVLMPLRDPSEPLGAALAGL